MTLETVIGGLMCAVAALLVYWIGRRHGYAAGHRHGYKQGLDAFADHVEERMHDALTDK